MLYWTQNESGTRRRHAWMRRRIQLHTKKNANNARVRPWVPNKSRERAKGTRLAMPWDFHWLPTRFAVNLFEIVFNLFNIRFALATRCLYQRKSIHLFGSRDFKLCWDFDIILNLPWSEFSTITIYFVYFVRYQEYYLSIHTWSIYSAMLWSIRLYRYSNTRDGQFYRLCMAGTRHQ